MNMRVFLVHGPDPDADEEMLRQILEEHAQKSLDSAFEADPHPPYWPLRTISKHWLEGRNGRRVRFEIAAAGQVSCKEVSGIDELLDLIGDGTRRGTLFSLEAFREPR